MKIYKVPTGHICTMTGQKGKKIEFLSIGDYGKEKNIKADFMGLTNEINGVQHGELLPLTEKWVITISSQYGCSMGCKFCDVPKVGKGLNATCKDLIDQVWGAINLHPEVKETKRLNLHYARMGEPTFNPNVIESAYRIRHLLSKNWGFHPVVSTMMPKKNKHLITFINDWLELKDWFEGEAGLQLSINTTDEKIRSKTMPHSMPLIDQYHFFSDVLGQREKPKGRKITLNFALTDAEVNAEKIREHFNPEYFICKITPMHQTKACIKRGLLTNNGYDLFYPYKKVEENLKSVGFDVIVFIPSKEEDESKITCGNAILSEKENK